MSRSFIRFALTPFLRDSATIIRATLHLQADVPLIGIPADTAQLVATSVLVDFGAKSPVVAGIGATLPLLPGATAADFDVTQLVKLWQGKTPTPAIIRLALGDEGGTFLFPLFRSTRSAFGCADAADYLPASFRLRGLLAMRRMLLSGVAATAMIAGSLRAQSSEFGIRGLGVPGRELSARGLALGGVRGSLRRRVFAQSGGARHADHGHGVVHLQRRLAQHHESCRLDVDARHPVSADSRRRADSASSDFDRDQLLALHRSRLHRGQRRHGVAAGRSDRRARHALFARRH